MTSARRLAAFAALVLGLTAAASAAHADDPSPIGDEGNLTVVVTDGTSPAPPSAWGTPGGGSQLGGSSGAGGTASGPSTSGGSAPAGSAPAGSAPAGSTPAGAAADGILSVGGLNTAVVLSSDAFGGTVRVWFTVHNGSKSPIDAVAEFQLATWPFEWGVDDVHGVAVTALQPGESRVVTADLHGAGQWTLLDTHVTLTPPASVDGVALTPVTRDALVFVLPWLVLVLLVAVLLAVVAIQIIRRSATPPAPLVATA